MSGSGWAMWSERFFLQGNIKKMTDFLRECLNILDDRQIADKNNSISNIALLLEKNNGRQNPTDYSLLLPTELLAVPLSQDDKDEIFSHLLNLLKKEPMYSSSIVWCVGKTFEENKIEAVLSAIIETGKCDDETFRQIAFLADVISSERIRQLLSEIESKRGK